MPAKSQKQVKFAQSELAKRQSGQKGKTDLTDTELQTLAATPMAGLPEDLDKTPKTVGVKGTKRPKPLLKGKQVNGLKV